jgi:cell division transport system ATP-binding protein
MIRLYHVFKSYTPKVWALNDINLRVEDGEFVFVVGPSGAGKSTLLRMIYMEELPTKGEVVVGRFTSSRMSSKRVSFLRRQVGVIFQDFKLLKDRSIYENVAFVLRVTGRCTEKDMKTKSLEALDKVGLYHRRNALPGEISGGEQQRVAIARGLVNEPFVLLADEPTGNLDAENTAQIVDLLRYINTSGTSVIMATHDRELVERYGGRILEIDQGVMTERIEVPRGRVAGVWT